MKKGFYFLSNSICKCKFTTSRQAHFQARTVYSTRTTSDMSTEVDAAPTLSSMTTSTFAFVGGSKKAQHGLRVNGEIS